MAKPVGFTGANTVARDPDANIPDLPGRLSKDALLTCWRLDVEDLTAINETGCMWIALRVPDGRSVPSIFVSGPSPILFADGSAPTPEPYIKPAPKRRD